jgi:tRNA (guanine-N1)-methyltransferase
VQEIRLPRGLVEFTHQIMRIDILTCQPALLESPFAHSIVKRAQDKGLAEIHVHDLRDYAINKHGQLDDYVFGWHGAARRAYCRLD